MFAATSCTDVDDSLGNSLIPNDQQMAMDFVSYTGDFMDAYMVKKDSFATSRIATGLVGSLYDDVFGRTSAEFACQYISYGIYVTTKDKEGSSTTSKPDESIEMGHAVADSMVLSLYFGLPDGDTTKTQLIHIYPLRKKLILDTTHYASDNLDDLVDFSTKIASFEYTGFKTRHRMNLKSDKALEMMAQMIDESSGIYEDSDKWYDMFPGLYFKTDDSSPIDASLLNISLDSTTLVMYGRNFTDEAKTNPKDTFYTMMTFWVERSETPNASAFVFKHDYTGTPIDPALFNDLENPLETTYIVAMDGPLTEFRFRDQFIADLKSKLVAPYRSIVINKAYLEVHSGETDTERLNNSLLRLGLYSDYYTYSSIKDYNYSAENKGSTIAYGGYLNRTTTNYGMDITAFVQQLISAEEPVKTMTGGPSYHEHLDPKGIILNTSTAPDNPNPMTLKVTYTLIK